MMNEAEFLSRYETETPIFIAWGDFVNQRILQQLSSKLKADEEISTFLKIYPVVPRLKGKDSIISKGFYRNKGYNNPYDQITDKIGVRYVVLLVEQISIISAIIMDNSTEWNISKDRDFEKERDLPVNQPQHHGVVVEVITLELTGGIQNCE